MATKKSHKSFLQSLKSAKFGMAVILLLFILLLCLYPDTNLFTWIAAKREIRAQERQMREYQLGIIDMQSRIRELTSDKDTLEQFARENFHFTEPGEDVYLIKE